MDGHRILLFSYGSGCVAALYTLRFNISSDCQMSNYAAIKQSAKRALNRLDQRVKHTPEQFSAALETRERIVSGGGNVLNSFGSILNLFLIKLLIWHQRTKAWWRHYFLEHSFWGKLMQRCDVSMHGTANKQRKWKRTEETEKKTKKRAELKIISWVDKTGIKTNCSALVLSHTHFLSFYLYLVPLSSPCRFCH